jgi:hypothetical protein
MDIEIIENLDVNGFLVEHVIIDRGNGEYTSMPKAIWDELQAKQTEGNLN